eukprot:6177386-Pleurochrysis_carterae.AAC.5
MSEHSGIEAFQLQTSIMRIYTLALQPNQSLGNARAEDSALDFGYKHELLRVHTCKKTEAVQTHRERTKAKASKAASEQLEECEKIGKKRSAHEHKQA